MRFPFPFCRRSTHHGAVVRVRARVANRAVVCVAAVLSACGHQPREADARALGAEISSHARALEALTDTLARHIDVTTYQLHWMEGVESAGSANLWDAMQMLTRRPLLRYDRAAFDDLTTRARLRELVGDEDLRRMILRHYRALEELGDAAEPEYRAVWEHYEAVLGPGEWRDVFSLEIGPDAFGVDYRKHLQALVDGNHAAVLRGALRGQLAYREEVRLATERAGRIIAAVSRAQAGG